MSSRNDGSVVGGVIVLAVLVLLFLFVGYLACFKTVEYGTVGVLTWFGKIEEGQNLEPGPHVINPLKGVVTVDVQPQRNEEPTRVPTSGGLPVDIKSVLVYSVDPNRAAEVLNKIGRNYEEKLVDVHFKNAVRDVCSGFTPEALYTTEQNTIEEKILRLMKEELEPRGFIVERVMLQDPVLPPVVAERIAAKLGAEQDVMRMSSMLKQKELEAQAKVVEAKGIAESQLIIKKDLDRNYLYYQYIQALKELAVHGNKIVYVPVGSDGLPMFKLVEEPTPAKK